MAHTMPAVVPNAASAAPSRDAKLTRFIEISFTCRCCVRWKRVDGVPDERAPAAAA
jgi:hypothetical protein